MIRFFTIRRLFGPWLKRILILDALGLLLVAGIWALGGQGDGGLGPYYRAVAHAVLSPRGLLLYTSAILTYSVILEFCLRRVVQEPLMEARAEWLRPLAKPLTALVYGATHLLYHPLGVLYAVLLGFGGATLYERERDWRLLALWHAQWNLLAIAGAIFLASAMPGEARSNFVYEYKKSRIEAGALTYVEGWGWRDAFHNHGAYYERAHAWATRGDTDTPLTLSATVTSPTGWHTPVRKHYVLTGAPKTPQQRWAVACSAVIDFAQVYERAQEDAFWWTGAKTSAWQFDDLPSTVLMCLEVAEFSGRSSTRRPEEIDASVLLAKWREEGMARVAIQEREVGPPQGAAPLSRREQNLLPLLVFGRQFWDVEE